MSDIIVLVWVAFIFFAAVVSSCISFVRLARLKKIRCDQGFLYSLSAVLIAFLLCLSIWPAMHRVYDDEYTYISQSVNILSYGKASTIIKGSRLHPEVFLPWLAFTKIPAFGWLEAVVLFLTRDFEHSYFILNMVLGALSVAVIYRVAWLWTASQAVAWWTAIVLACLPVRITYAMSASSDIAGFFFFLLFLLFISEYKARQSKFLLYTALFCGIYCMCIRLFDSIFVLSALGAALYMYRRDGLLEKKTCRQLLADAGFLLLPVFIAVPLMYMYYSSSIAFSLSFLFQKLCTNILYFFNPEQSSLAATLLAVFAVGRSVFYKKDNLANALAGWFLAGLFIISTFYAGRLSYPGDAYSDRYFLSFAFPYLLLAGKGAADLTTMAWPRLLRGVLFIVLIVNALSTAHYLNTMVKEGYYYKKALLLRQMASVIPSEAYIIEECAALVAAETSKKSIQTTLFLGGDHPEEVVFLKGIQDFTDPHRTVLAEKILSAEYLCKPLAAAPFNEGDLSVAPLLCSRAQHQDHQKP